LLPLQRAGKNLCLCTQVPSGTALRHSEEMRMNKLEDGHALRYCHNRASQMLRRNKHRDKNQDNFMKNVAKTMSLEYIFFA